MKIGDLLPSDNKPLFIVGQEKNSGKTVTLNRLRAEADKTGLSDFAMCTIGFDGEDKDHLSGKPKPTVTAYKGDLIVSCASLLPVMEARVKVIWSDSYSGSLGRLVLGRVERTGKVQLVGPRTVKQLNKLIEMMNILGARYILIDGAADRQTQITASEGSKVCLTFRPKLKENIGNYCSRIMSRLFVYGLPRYEGLIPFFPQGDEIIFFGEKDFQIIKSENLSFVEDETNYDKAYVPGPLTDDIMLELERLKAKTIVIKNPSHVFVDNRVIARAISKRISLQYLDKPELAFVSVRSDGGNLRSVSPIKLIAELENKLDVPCFDAMYSLLE